MSEAVELKRLVRQLQSISNEQDIVSVLNTFKNGYEVNEAILRESKAGLAVGKLRSHASKEVADLAKEIVKKWKTAVEKAKTGKTLQSKNSANGKAGPERKASMSSTPGTPVVGKGETRTSKTDGIKTGLNDATRAKCAELIYDALAFDATAPNELVLRRALGIESNVYNQYNGTTTEYKSRIRSLYVNLKDKNNPMLRENIVTGDLPVEKFCSMKSDEMASEERKAADNKIREDNLYKTLGAGEREAETDAFQCSRCKQRKCRYRQAQTRSADEPMTTFVTCTVCNNRWKFS